MLASLALSSCHSDWEAIYADCLNTGRCVSAGPDASVELPVITVDRASVSFPDVVIFERSAAEQLIITNQGPGEVSALSFQLPGAHFADFTVASQCTAALLPGATCSASVSFNPVAVGPRSIDLLVTPAGQTPLRVPLSGSGLPALEFSPVPLIFPDTSVGSQSRQALTLVNNTAIPQTPVFASDGPFVRDPACATIGARSPCTFAVTFFPDDAGVFTGSLSAGIASPQPFTASALLQGNGLALGSLRLSSASPFDGEVADAGSALTASFTLLNVATTAIGPITVSVQPAGSAFTIVDAGCVALDAGASCSGALRFLPPRVGEFDATLVANAGLGGSATAPLHAIGAGTLTAQVTVTPAGPEQVITDGGFQCSGTCPLAVYVVPPAWPTVVLEAQRSSPRTGFERWSGACSGEAPSCSLVLDADKSVTAHYGRVNVAFVSSFSVTGNFGGVDGGDALCQQAALDGGLPGSFRAWLSTTQVNAAARVPDAGGWIRVDGRPFAASLESLVKGEVLYPLSLDQHGAAVDGGLAWTNTRRDGGAWASTDCQGWTSTSSTGGVGLASGGSTLWTEALSEGCGTPRRLYCFQVDQRIGTQKLAVPLGSRLMFLSSPGLLDAGFVGLDARCNQEALAAGWDAGFGALVGGMGTTPASRIDRLATGPLYRPDGVMLLPDVGALISRDTDLLAAPNVTASGAFVVDETAPTAIGATGLRDEGVDHCADWTSDFILDTVALAEPRTSAVRSGPPAASGYFMAERVGGCREPARVYCVPR